MAGDRKTAESPGRRRQAVAARRPRSWLSGLWQSIAPAPTTARRKRPRAVRAGSLPASGVLGLLLALAGCAPDVAVAGLLRLMAGD